MSQLVYGGEKIYFTWEEPGQYVGPNKSYITTNSGKKPTVSPHRSSPCSSVANAIDFRVHSLSAS